MSEGIQPDEDDYGYVSHEASAFYKKLIDKYGSADSTNDKSTSQKGKSQKELNNAKVSISLLTVNSKCDVFLLKTG